MLAFLKTRYAAGASAVTAMVISASASAQEGPASVLPADFDATMQGVSTDITTVGAALIGLAVVALGIKWVKATFFG